MSRNFGAVSSENLDLGDITGARFSEAADWSVLGFFRIEETATDDRCIISKWQSAGSTRQFIFRTDKLAAPSRLEVYANGGIKINGGAGTISLDTWYLGCVTQDAATDTITLYTYNIDGTVVDDGITGTHDTDKGTLTAPIRIGGTAANGDPMDGDIAHVCYVDGTVTQEEVLQYLYNPVKTANYFRSKYGLQFYLPVFGASSEPDLGGANNAVTVNGTVTSGDNPPVPISFGWDTLVPYEVSAAGLTVNLGIATETDTVPGVLGRAKSKAVGIASETDSALSITPNRAYAIGLASETDTALGPLTIPQNILLGIAIETDTVPGALGKAKSKAIGLASETDSALAITAERAYALGIASETDTALGPITIPKLVVLGIATEADSALPLGSAKAKAIGLASEADSALSIIPERTYAVGLPSEADSALALTIQKSLQLGIASETDSAFPITIPGAINVPVGLASETDSALAFSIAKAKAIGIAVENDSALAMTIRRTYTLNIVVETDAALPMTVKPTRLIRQAVEVDSALSITPVLSSGPTTQPGWQQTLQKRRRRS